ncbi:MAG TPA: hypothetical protein VGJ97_13345 [Anaerolineaceae bacterium]|jgi:lysylphosphatidylglycerol synthetase-like protein (DUF2156 family)
MDNQNSRRLPEPNPVTRDIHQRQVLWQVFVPVILSAIVLIGLGVLVTVSGSPEQVTRFSDISIIFLILPTLLTAFIFLALFAAIIFLLARLLKIIPPYSRLAQIYLNRLTGMLQKAADMAADPILSVESKYAGIKSIFQKESADGSTATQPAQEA